MVICLERGADLHMAQLMPLPHTVSSFSKIQIGLTFLVPAHLGSPGQKAVKRVCVCAVNKHLGFYPHDATLAQHNDITMCLSVRLLRAGIAWKRLNGSRRRFTGEAINYTYIMLVRSQK